MGPFRRQLILGPMIAALATPVWAEVCDKQRPEWNPADGQMTGFGEAYYLFTSLPGLAILGAVVLAATGGVRIYWLLAALFSGAVAAALVAVRNDPTGLTELARIEGCVGPATIPVTICAAIAAVTLIIFFRTSGPLTKGKQDA